MEKKEDLQENSENLNQEENSKNNENLSKLDSEKNESNKEETKELNLEDKIKELEDKVVRTMAEMENQRRRFEKEKEDAFEYGGFAFAKEALNLIDNLERSKQSLESDQKLKDTEALKKISEHLDVIYKDVISIFKKNNVEAITAINKKLDPNLHQAMMEIEDDSKEPGTIVQEVQKGFMLKDRLLRPSLVGVSTKSSNNNKKETEDKKDDKNQPKIKEN